MHGEAESRAKHREGDACVAAAGVEHSLAGREQATVARILNHRCGGAVLHAAAWIHPFGLGQQRDTRKSLDRMVETEQRRASDTLGKGNARFGLRLFRFHGEIAASYASVRDWSQGETASRLLFDSRRLE
jgi:hypothetical protein